ncbi:MAG: hypothetical protein VKO00_05715 [Cyanobacteriota bacterium]|nr:hypothetical protein [Cyanobacteriota bacterium]
MYFLLDPVDVLDLSAIVIPAQSKDPRGEKGFDPRMMTLLQADLDSRADHGDLRQDRGFAPQQGAAAAAGIGVVLHHLIHPLNRQQLRP